MSKRLQIFHFCMNYLFKYIYCTCTQTMSQYINNKTPNMIVFKALPEFYVWITSKITHLSLVTRVASEMICVLDKSVVGNWSLTWVTCSSARHFQVPLFLHALHHVAKKNTQMYVCFLLIDVYKCVLLGKHVKSCNKSWMRFMTESTLNGCLDIQ